MFEKMLLAISMLFTGLSPVDNSIEIVNNTEEGDSTIDMTMFEVKRQWFEEYKKDGYESYNSIIESKNGGFICVGQTTVRTDGPLGDGLIVKYSEDGSVLWENQLLGDDTDYYSSVTEDSQGNIYVIGKTFSGDLDFVNDNYIPHGIIVKYSSSGVYQWTMHYNDGGRQITFKDVVHSDNSLFIVGERHYVDSRTGYLTISSAESGMVEKVVYFQTNDYNTNLKSIIKLKDGSFLLVGNSVNKTTSKEYPLAIKIQKNGTQVWTYDFSQNTNINKEGSINSALELEDGSILLSGFTKDDTRKSSLIVKLNKNGALIFENEEYENYSEEAKFIGINANEEIITTGQRTPLGNYSLKSDLEIFVKKYDKDGNFINQSLLNNSKNMKNIDSLITTKDELIVVGESYIEETEASKCNTRNAIDECLDANSYVYVGKLVNKCNIDKVPVLNVLNKTININVGEMYNVMDGVTATEDGLNVLHKVSAVPDSIDTDVKGEKVITYTLSGECGTVIETRTVNVVDPCDTTTVPIISMTNKTVTVNKGDTVNVLDGVTATENGQTLPMDRITATPNSINTNSKGTHTITYTVGYDCGTIIETKTINVVDPCDTNTLPVINIVDTIKNYNLGDNIDLMDGVTVTDDGHDLPQDKITVTPSTIDSNQKGRYTITYKASDDCGEVEATRIINVIDSCDTNILPVINIANKNVTINKNDTINLMDGVTAVDEGKNLTDTIVVTPETIDTSIKGTHTITYKVSDECGETTETKTITVIDPCDTNNLPVINIANKIITVNKGDVVNVMDGVTATDDGNDLPTNRITTTPSTIDTSVRGTHTITYKVSDECGETIETKTVNVIDPCDTNTLPVINIANKTIAVNKGEVIDLMNGVTATDDGNDLPIDRITVTPNTIDTNVKGTHTITYKVSDECGETTETKTINIIDPCDTNDIPVIIVQDKVVTINKGQAINVLDGVTATDSGQVLPLDRITATPNTIDTNVKGKHIITYTVSDDCREVSDTKEIIVVDPCDTESSPSINVKSEYVVLELGATFDLKEGVTVEKNGVDLKDKLVVTPDKIDTSIEGTTEVTYKVDDDCGEVIKKITVVVAKNPCAINDLPIINVDNLKLEIELGKEFKPLEGIIATDKEDGDITDRVEVIKNDVKIDSIGEYEVVYSVTDNCGLNTEKVVLIKVVDNPCAIDTKPEIIVSDKEILLGQKINPLEWAKAKDGDKDLTSSITIKENTIDINKVGEYKIVYAVSDECNSVEKEIKVKVSELPEVKGEEDEIVDENKKPENKPVNNEETPTKKPQTGDDSIIINIVMIVISFIGLAINIKNKRI